MSKKNVNTKETGAKKYKRRKWLTFLRMIRYGVNNFSRNAWLTIAATAVMTITLLIVFLTLAARGTLLVTVDNIRSQVDMSIYIQSNTPEDSKNKIINHLKNLSTVRKVRYMSSDEARTDYAKKNKSDAKQTKALNNATNEFPGIIRVNLVDINNTSELDEFIKTNDDYKQFAHPDYQPSFAGERREAIETIGKWVSFADRAGMTVSVVFVIISSLIVFNTIRMAIFNRKEEIQMMKLIGAERSFIRGPFLVEAIMYGFIAAILATGIGLAILMFSRDALVSYEVAIAPTINFIVGYIGFILLGMIGVGALIGVISSLLATRRYLKI
jgi:cell division transport system permease protein